MKHSFTSILLLSILLHLSSVVLAAPINGHGQNTRALTVSRIQHTTILKGKATPTELRRNEESAASATALTPKITDW
ncbi:hypothetical protein FRB90_002836, partial [Tulasnella sp. 427]